jgi:hypothetical protein
VDRRLRPCFASLFPKKGTKRPRAEVFKALSHVKETTVVTMIGDLKNPKYSGEDGLVEIKAEGEYFVRLQ